MVSRDSIRTFTYSSYLWNIIGFLMDMIQGLWMKKLFAHIEKRI